MANRPQEQQPPRPGSPRPAEEDKRDSGEQSGSTGRNPGTGDPRKDGANTGQDRYGMTGGADRNAPQPGHESGSSGTSDYGRSDYPDDADHEHGSNPGSGRADRDESQTQSTPASPSGTRKRSSVDPDESKQHRK